MCRIRFGLTGVYFDPLEPSRPREESFQPLIATVPPLPHNKQEDAVLEAIDSELITGKIATATENSKNGEGVTNILESSLPTESKGTGRLAKIAKRDRACVESKRNRESSSSSPSLSLSSSSSSTSVSSPPLIDEDQLQEKVKSKRSLRGFRPTKPVNSEITQKRNSNPSKRHTSTPPKTLTRPPPAKRVRFAMDVHERPMPRDDASDTSSSRSSDDSYTDPPSPAEPYDAFAGYYRATGASKFHRIHNRVARSGMQSPAEEDVDIEVPDDLVDCIFDGEDGSEVDVQGLPVKGRPLRTVQIAGKGRASDYRRRQDNSTLPSPSAIPGRGIDPSQTVPCELQSNVDAGLNLDRSPASFKQSVRSLRSNEQLRYPKLRYGKNLPEPIFVVRPRFTSTFEAKRKPADMLDGSGNGNGTLKSANEDTKTSSPCPGQIKAAKQSKNPK